MRIITVFISFIDLMSIILYFPSNEFMRNVIQGGHTQESQSMLRIHAFCQATDFICVPVPHLFGLVRNMHIQQGMSQIYCVHT